MDKPQNTQMIPIDKIHILNPRNRDKRKFGEIVSNISHLGLKRPIVVSRRGEIEGDTGTIWSVAKAARKLSRSSGRL